MAAQTQIGQQLRFVNRGELVNRFDLQHQSRLDDNVHPEFQGEPLSLVYDRQRNLALKYKAGVRQFPAKTFFVSQLRQPRTKLPMHFDAHADDPTAQPYSTALSWRWFVLSAFVPLW